MLLGAVSLVLAVLGFVESCAVYSPRGGVTTFRWLLFATSTAGFALATIAARDRRQARRRAGGRRGADRAGARADLRARSGLRLVDAMRPGARHRMGLPLRVRLRRLWHARRRSAPCLGWIGVAVLLAHPCRRWRQGHAGGLAAGAGASAPAGCWSSGCARAGRCRPTRRAARRTSSRSGANGERSARGAAIAPLAGGPERHHEKAREQGKLPVRERIARLLDDGSLRRGGAAGQLGGGRAWAPTASSPAWDASPGGRSR